MIPEDWYKSFCSASRRPVWPSSMAFISDAVPLSFDDETGIGEASMSFDTASGTFSP